MGMSTHIKAFIPDTDSEYQRHKKVLVACVECDVSLPKETAEYFGNDIGNLSLLDDKLEFDIKNSNCLSEWSDYNSGGYEIDITKLPLGVTKIRFYNSW